MNTLLLNGLILLGVSVLAYGGVAWWYLTRGTPPSEVPPFMRESVRGPRIVVIGDSTAFGVGTTDARYSIAGRLGEAFPSSPIVNSSKSGAKVADAILLMEAVPMTGAAQFILLQIGANDVIGRTDSREYESNLRTLFEQAKKRSDHVFMLTAGDIGLAPIFPFPINHFVSRETLRVREISMRVAKEMGVVYIDLFKSRAYEPTLTDIKRFYATDLFHLSNEGYGIWYQSVEHALRDNGLL